MVRAQLDATRFAERAGAVAALLSRERPDLVGLQEVSRWVSTGPDGEHVLADFLPMLLDALEAAGCPYDAHARTAAFGGSLPVSGTEWVSLSGANVTLVRRGGPVRVLGETTGTFAAGPPGRHRHRRRDLPDPSAAGAGWTCAWTAGRCGS